ncbi:MAG TPA: hypothetical protein PKG88_00275 [Bacteroidales bacterium]|nr:hypothetical protein [Bacteroidales bacterium]
MNNKNKILVLITLLVLLSAPSLFARKYVGTIQAPVQKESATCLPATNSNQLTINNVRAYVETNGTMWFKEIAQYEVPRGSGKTSMFAAALWIGGRDVSGQLRLAAVRFRQNGDDYWTGPLTIEGASINQQTCSKYDKHFKITRAEVEAHIAAHATNDPTYTTPASITQWPAHGENGQSYYLAPFKDVNEDGVYDYNDGDYPYYDLENELCPWTPENIALAAQDLLPWTPERTWIQSNYGYDNKMIYADHVLKGDETLFWIFNDKGGPHTESQGDPIGLEIRGQAFAFATNDELNNMTFYSYEIINRSTFALTNTFFSQWVDPDLGFAEDDFVGCDVLRGLGYCYNGKEVDGQGLAQHYGAQPPAVGVDFFQGPYIDPDDRDNPRFFRDSIGSTGYCDKFVNSTEITGFPSDQMAINGVNFGDNIIDNERFGMRRFVYHDNNNTPRGDPDVAFEYYNLLQGIWKDGTRMQWGQNAYRTGGVECDFMFPGDSDPCKWGTAGITPAAIAGGDGTWTESNVGNAPYDRRFMQSAGPFTLKAGAVNYITVGIPWARASQGGAWASVELLKIADDKCQALFENCFKVLDGPDAPDLTIRELNQELILYITNDDPLSNNYLEQYEETDTQIPDNIPGTTTPADKKYRFEGYQIFQLKDKDINISDINNTDKARIVAQCDIENIRENGSSIGQLINWEYNDALGTSVPVEKVNGSNTGIFHTLKVTEDAFATGSKTLVNYKTYYFIVIAYAYNEFAPYSINPDITNGLYGQKTVYLAGRKAAGGKSIKPISAIPHPSTSHNEGTVLNSQYGTTPLITRIQGQGNGGNFVDLTDETVSKIMNGGDNNNWSVNNVTYKNNAGPLSISVIDPLKVQPLDYIIKFVEPDSQDVEVSENATWVLEFDETVTDQQIIDLGYKNLDGTAQRAIPSQKSISATNEQLFLPLGIAVSIKNTDYQIHQDEVSEWLEASTAGLNYRNKYLYGTVDYIGSSIEYTDSSKPWLWGVEDTEGNFPSNWIRSGVQAIGPWSDDSAQDGDQDEYTKWKQNDMHIPVNINDDGRATRAWKDPIGQFENIVGRTWAPYVLSSPYDGGPQAKYVTPDDPDIEPSQPYFTFWLLSASPNCPGYNFTMTNQYSVDIVLTPDKSKWTRCVVLEACDDKTNSIGNALRHEPRKSQSVDKNGNPDGTGTGMGWFPGYAINVETGERLNIMFTEDSSMPENNGDDMLFNPSSVYAVNPEGEAINEATYNFYREAFAASGGDPQYDAKIVWGGKHFIYVMNSVGNTASSIFKFGSRTRNWNDDGNIVSSNSQNNGGYFTGSDNSSYAWYDCGAYDEGKWVKAKFDQFVGLNNDDPSATVYNRRRQLKMQLFNNVMWTSIPMPAPYQENNWLSNDAKVKIRVSRPYLRFSSRWLSDQNTVETLPNKGYPMYSFTTKNIAPTTKEVTTHTSILDNINIVPNPYYGFSAYESTALETYVKITNLPEKCDISIFTVSGTLVKRISKGDAESTFVTWDLKNDAAIPVAGGIYIIHINAPNIGERTLKFFCAMRPTDLNAF